MKLIIQIPCYNEEKTLPLVLDTIPKHIPGIDIIETQIIDDGSTDHTADIARQKGVTYIVSYIGNKGLGKAFKRGVDNALDKGADILVNTDGDNQYNSSEITKLVQPILNKKADIVIGNRNPGKLAHFSPIKRLLQKIGSCTIAFLTGMYIPDAVSGFRAYSRQALKELNVTSDFSYVLDTTIQAGKKRIAITYVDISANPPTRPSRLFKNIWQHIKRSGSNMIRVYTMYEPLKVFLSIGLFFLIIGLYPISLFLYFYFKGEGSGHIQSLILSIMFVIIGIQFIGLGIIGDLLEKQRRITEEISYMLKEKKK